MKANLIHICFVIDESGSMYSSASDVIGGFNNLIEEQKKIKNGECVVSLFRFSDKVRESFIGKNVQDITDFEYNPGGCTAMNDGIGTAIDKVGKWLDSMKEEDKPSKNMIVIMTDGMENASKEYKLDRVREMIKHQTEKYSWEFVYMGTDITNFDDATSLGIHTRSVSSRDNVWKNYDTLNTYAGAYRSANTVADLSSAKKAFESTLDADTATYTIKHNFKV